MLQTFLRIKPRMLLQYRTKLRRLLFHLSNCRKKMTKTVILKTREPKELRSSRLKPIISSKSYINQRQSCNPSRPCCPGNTRAGHRTVTKLRRRRIHGECDRAEKDAELAIVVVDNCCARLAGTVRDCALSTNQTRCKKQTGFGS